MSDQAKAVFLSYASQDAEAAKKICEALRAAGVEVWFDTDGGLEHGDEWDAKIRRQIKECVLFLAIISANTQAREEGYFRIEWDLAAERARGIASGVAFILPVVIDDTREPAALVPDRFRSVQWTRLPGGQVPPDVLQRFLKLWSHRTGVLKHEANAPRAAVAETNEMSRGPARARPIWPWLALGVLALLGAGLIFKTRGGRTESAPVATDALQPVAAVTPPPAAVPERAGPKDPDLRRAVKLVDDINSIHEDFLLAEEIARKVVDKSPADPEAVTVLAHVESSILTRNFDFTAERTALARRYSERAVQLAPDDPMALAALAMFLTQRGGDHPRAEELLRRAVQLAPTEPAYARYLALVISRQNGAAGTAAALKLFEALAPQFPQDPLVHYDLSIRYRDNGRYPEAERELDATLALAPVANAIDWKARFALMRGDLPAARMWLDRAPPRLQAEERAVLSRVTYALFSGDVAYGLRSLDRFAETWFYDASNYTGPRSLLLGALREREGNAELARTLYEAALTEIRRYREEHPSDPGAFSAEAWTLLGLGRQPEARAANKIALAGLARPYRYFAPGLWWFYNIPRTLLVDDRPAALAQIREAVEEPFARAPLRLRFAMDPRLAPFRADPEIVALLAEPAPAPAASAAGAVTAPPLDDKSVAVLAFANLSDDKNNEYFSDGISEELLNVLAKVPGLKVTARTSSFYFKGKEVPVPEIARQLGVAYVIEGSVRKQGEKVRITAQLIKAADGFHVWSDTFTRELKDIFAVQDEIAGLIAQNLSLKLGVPSAAAAPNPAALTHLFQARFFSRQDNNDGWRRSIEECRAALAVDAGFAPAAAEMARSYVQLARFGGIAAEEGLRAARGPAERAVALDPNLAEAHDALGWVQRTADWDWSRADASFRRAVELAPQNATIVSDYAIVRANQGYFEEAQALARRALELDPLNATTRGHYSLFLAWHHGDLEEAARQIRRALELSPAAIEWHSYLARYLALLGRFDEAAAAAELEPAESYRLVARGLVLVARGDGAGADRVLRDLTEKYGDSMGLYIAELHAAARRNDEAFNWLERARQRHDTALCWTIGSPWLQLLAQDPRWTELLQKLGHPAP